MIRYAEKRDAEDICNIYNYYVVNTTITFEEQVVSIEEMRDRISEILERLPYLVFEEDGKVIGYAYATKWKARSAYKYSVETTVYLHKDRSGFGIGTKLYQSLLEELKFKGLHRAIGGVALPNKASVSLHEKLGFKKVAEFGEVGNKFNKWINVGYWEYTI
ncbi:GNAT family N-acetyltransferase [Candidatus Peregrinibacteria bacterium]|nr:GNAT family N-acetyltransferase [Candidatus Peregrinibacteria bacterium]